MPPTKAAYRQGPWFTIVIKSANQDKVSNVTLANDSELVLALAAGSKYLIRHKIFYNVGNLAADFKFATFYSGTTTSVVSKRSHITPASSGGSAEDAIVLNTTIPSQSALGGAGIGYVEIETIIVTNTAGTFAFQWAQNTSHATATSVIAGSYLEWKQF